MRLPENIGFILLAIWLILFGLLQFSSLDGPYVLLGLLALASGTIILVNHLNTPRGRKR